MFVQLTIMKNEELICIAIAGEKYFYRASLAATQKDTPGGPVTEGSIPDGKIREFHSTIETSIEYKDGQKAKEISADDVKVLNEALDRETKIEAQNNPPHPAADFINSGKTGLTYTFHFTERVFFQDNQEIARQTLGPAGAVLKHSGQTINGTARNFYPNGGLRQETYFANNITEGESKTYDPNGRIIAIENYKNGLMEGEASHFNFTKGILTEQKLEYKKGKLDGTRKAYGPGGGVIGIEYFKNGKLEGLRETYYFNGKKESSATYKEDILEGKRLFYYDSGILNFEENFEHGKLQGKRTAFYPSGKIYFEENYKDDLLEGERIVYDEDGKVKAKELYQKGTHVQN